MAVPFVDSRRTFLGAVATGCALPSLILRPGALRAADPSAPRVEFLVVSDTHLGYQGKEAAESQWTKTAAELSKAPGGLILHLGDVVDGGREPQYAVYKRIRDTIGKSVHEVPGNHDPHDLFEKHVRKPIDTAVDHGRLRFLLLGNARVDSHDGFLSEAQLRWIDERCADAATQDRHVILCLHVPVHDNRHPDRGWHVKPEHGQKAFYEILTRHQRRIVAVFHGHFHNGLRGWDDHAPVHEIVFPSALYNQNRRLEEQKAPGYNLPEFRPGYTLVEIAGPTMTLRYKPLGAEPAAEKACRVAALEQTPIR